MKIQKESFTHNLLSEMTVLLEEHNEETASSLGAVDISPEFYTTLEDNNMLLIVTAREDDNELKGYLVLMITPHPHHQSIIVASQDGLFLQKEVRKGFTGHKLIKKAEEILKGTNVKYITMTCSQSLNLSKYYSRIGYRPLEETFIKEI